MNAPSPTTNKNEIKRAVVCGDLLQGAACFSCAGVEEWTDYPRYRVVAIHMNRITMFLETLNPEGEVIGCEMMDITSDQWKHWN